MEAHAWMLFFLVALAVSVAGDDVGHNQPEMKADFTAIVTRLNDLLYGTPEELANGRQESKNALKEFKNFMNEYDAEKFGDLRSSKDNIDVEITSVERGQKYVWSSSNDIDGGFAVELSSELISEVYDLHRQQSSNLQISSVVHKTPGLFQPDQDEYMGGIRNGTGAVLRTRTLDHESFGENPVFQLRPWILGDVISLDMANISLGDVENPLLAQKLIYQIPRPFIPDYVEVDGYPTCTMWDNATQDWSAEGCDTDLLAVKRNVSGHEMTTESGYLVTCQCHRITSLAIVLIPSYIYRPAYTDPLTVIGCVVDMVALALVLITILYYGQLRTHTAHQLIGHVCVNRIIFNIIFLSGIDLSPDYTYMCMETSITLHFFMLTTWGCLFLKAIFLFLSYVKISKMKDVRDKVVSVGTIVIYGMAITVATMLLALQENYLGIKYCWLSLEALLPFVAYPVAGILITNLIIFASITYSIWSVSEDQSLNAPGQRVKRVVSMIFTLGIPWIFGFLMLLSQTPEMKRTFAVIFSISNIIQAFMIFVAFCALQDQVMLSWKTLIGQPVELVGDPEEKFEEGKTTKTTQVGVKIFDQSEIHPSNAIRKEGAYAAVTF